MQIGEVHLELVVDLVEVPGLGVVVPDVEAGEPSLDLVVLVQVRLDVLQRHTQLLDLERNFEG